MKGGDIMLVILFIIAMIYVAYYFIRNYGLAIAIILLIGMFIIRIIGISFWG